MLRGPKLWVNLILNVIGVRLRSTGTHFDHNWYIIRIFIFRVFYRSLWSHAKVSDPLYRFFFSFFQSENFSIYHPSLLLQFQTSCLMIELVIFTKVCFRVSAPTICWCPLIGPDGIIISYETSTTLFTHIFKYFTLPSGCSPTAAITKLDHETSMSQLFTHSFTLSMRLLSPQWSYINFHIPTFNIYIINCWCPHGGIYLTRQLYHVKHQCP